MLKQAETQIQQFVSHQRNPLARDEIKAIVRLVHQAEQDALKASQLRTISRTQALDDAQWRELYFLHYLNELEMNTNQSEVEERVWRLARSGLLNPRALTLMHGLQWRLDEVDCHYLSAASAWIGLADRIEPRLPTWQGNQITVRSFIAPGKVLGAFFVGGYPSDKSARGQSGAGACHLPGLALTGLVDSWGFPLFVGLHHGVFHGHEPGGERWAAQALPTASKPTHCESMLADTAAASLLCDPERFRQALDGKTVAANLFSIALLTPGDVEMWSGQHEQLHRYAESNTEPIKLHLYNRQGSPRQVGVCIRARQFVLSATAERIGLGQRQVERHVDCATRLLGPMDSPQLGGDIKSKIDALKANICEARQQHLLKQLSSLQVERVSGKEHPIALLNRKKSTRQGFGIARLDGHIRILEEAGMQLKAMWRPEGDWPAGIDAHRKTAARLALVGCLMDELPLLSCAVGTDLTARLDSEIKLLATAASAPDGHLPSNDLNTEAWRKARAAFEPGRATR